MYLKELLSNAHLVQSVDIDTEVVLVPANVFPWAKYNMVVTRSDWERVYIDYKPTEPDIEAVLSIVFNGADRDFMRNFAQVNIVATTYQLLSDNMDNSKNMAKVDTALLSSVDVEVSVIDEVPVKAELVADATVTSDNVGSSWADDVNPDSVLHLEINTKKETEKMNAAMNAESALQPAMSDGFGNSGFESGDMDDLDVVHTVSEASGINNHSASVDSGMALGFDDELDSVASSAENMSENITQMPDFVSGQYEVEEEADYAGENIDGVEEREEKSTVAVEESTAGVKETITDVGADKEADTPMESPKSEEFVADESSAAAEGAESGAMPEVKSVAEAAEQPTNFVESSVIAGRFDEMLRDLYAIFDSDVTCQDIFDTVGVSAQDLYDLLADAYQATPFVRSCATTPTTREEFIVLVEATKEQALEFESVSNMVAAHQLLATFEQLIYDE